MLELIIRVQVSEKELFEKDNEVLEVTEGEIGLDQLICSNVQTALEQNCELKVFQIETKVHKVVDLKSSH